jgi:hypothetical protein
MKRTHECNRWDEPAGLSAPAGMERGKGTRQKNPGSASMMKSGRGKTVSLSAHYLTILFFVMPSSFPVKGQFQGE